MNSDNTDRTLPGRIADRFAAAPRKAWTPRDFADLGRRAAVDKALQRLVKSGEIRRIGRGLYDKPQFSKLLGELSVPDCHAVIDAVTRRDQARFIVDGMTAANAIGLTNAVPAKIQVFVDARLKTINLGGQKIVFMQAAPSRLYWAGRPGMYLVQALHWFHDMLHNKRVRSQLDRDIRRLLAKQRYGPDGPELVEDLRVGFSALPIWMQEILRQPIIDNAAADGAAGVKA